MDFKGRLRLTDLNKKKGTVWSLSKSVRFPSSESKHKSEPGILPSSFTKKSITMGFGGRWNFKPVQGADSPAANIYKLPSSFNSPVGPKLGKKPKRIDENGIPGPGTYNITQTPGKNSPKFSIQSKFKDFTPKKTPSPVAYFPTHIQSFRKTYWEIGFGYGTRIFLKNCETDSPGPGYILPSKFDKFKKKKYIPNINVFT